MTAFPKIKHENTQKCFKYRQPTAKISICLKYIASGLLILEISFHITTHNFQYKIYSFLPFGLQH